jgi:predicted RecA/RadA family phage recombinase
MQNYVQPGHTITLAAPYDRLSGEGAMVGAIFGVAAGDVLNTVEGEFTLVGVFDLAKDTADAFSVGDRVYWDDTQKNCVNSTTEGDLEIGVAIAAAAEAATTVRVRLHGVTT